MNPIFGGMIIFVNLMVIVLAIFAAMNARRNIRIIDKYIKERREEVERSRKRIGG